MPNQLLRLSVLLVATLTTVHCEFKLLLLHTNDMHSRFEETNAHSGQCFKGRAPCFGGFARLKTAVDVFRKRAQSEGASSIFLNAGDTYQGTVYYTMFKWRVVAEMINQLGIDVMSLGNHEFDDGPEGLAPFLANVTVPVVSSNIDYSAEHLLADNPGISRLTRSYVLDFNHTKVGVIGYLTPDTKFVAKTGAVEIHDEIPAVTREAQRLKKEGVNILIAVGHSGYGVDQLIAKHVPDLDVVVGGHTNTFLYTGKAPDIEKPEGPYPTVVKQASGREVLVVQAYAYTKYLGHLMLTFDDKGEVVKSEGNPVLLTEEFKKDGEVERHILKYSNEVKEKTGRKIGISRTFLEADDRTCRLRECNFGNLVTDALIEMNVQDFNGQGWTDAPIAMVQGGSLRTSINTNQTRGEITYADLLTTLPFHNSVERLTLTGSVLAEALEHSVARYDVMARYGEFMQFSGVRVVYDLSKPTGHRMVTATVRCGDCTIPEYHPLDHSKTYRVLTNSFLADGGDGYKMLVEASDRTVLSFTDRDAVENYITKRSPVHPEVQGRITLVTSPNSAVTTSYSLSTLVLALAALRILSAV